MGRALRVGLFTPMPQSGGLLTGSLPIAGATSGISATIPCACHSGAVSECAFGPYRKGVRKSPLGPPPRGGFPPYLQSWQKNLKCSCTICTLRFQNFSSACCRQVRTRTGMPPCLQTKSIILTQPLHIHAPL